MKPTQITDKKTAMAKRMPQTPFQMIGSGVKNAAKKVGGFLEKQFVEPTRNVNRIQNAKMQDMDKKAKRGDFNQR